MKTCSKDDCDYPSFSKGYCRNHQYLRVDKSVPTLRKSAVRPVMKPQAYPKPTGEAVLFNTIWNTRPHKSQLSGKPIHEARPGNFAHIVAKGKRPDLRLFENNIILLTIEEHSLLDQGTIKQREAYAREHNCDWSLIDKMKEIILS